MTPLRSRLILAVATATFLTAAASSLANGQAAKPEPAKAPAFKNLKVFPADIPRDQLIGSMKTISASLGVKCTHCHVGVEGKRETMDFASDSKREKLVARSMMVMTRHINEKEFSVTDPAKPKVTCFTCHRGAAKPLTAPPA
jgi:hypothetical protein